MRTFIAVPLPVSLKKSLRSIQSPHDGIRWQTVDNFHITIQFLGNITDQQLDVLTKKLAEIKQHTFFLPIYGWGTFPKKGRPRVIWAAVEPIQNILNLHEAIFDICEDIDLAEEHRSFVPHITLGRVTGALHKKELAKMLDEPTAKTRQILVDGFAVYRSKLSPGGAKHQIIKEYLLSG